MADHSNEHDTAVAEPAISDLDLRNTIEEALWSINAIRETKPDVEVAVNHGQATVSGIVSSPMMRREIQEALQGWPVELFLLDDAAIQNAAALALALDARTKAIRPGYRVTSQNGHISVTGKFTAEQAQAIKEVAGEVTGVKGVSVRSFR
jgi:osmotically-inducible protein OsmY